MSYYTDNQEDERLVERAISAWFKYGGFGTPMPSRDSNVETIKGKRYVVLVNTNGILAVYRVRNDGKLKSLKRFPKELEVL